MGDVFHFPFLTVELSSGNGFTGSIKNKNSYSLFRHGYITIVLIFSIVEAPIWGPDLI